MIEFRFLLDFHKPSNDSFYRWIQKSKFPIEIEWSEVKWITPIIFIAQCKCYSYSHYRHIELYNSVIVKVQVMAPDGIS